MWTKTLLIIAAIAALSYYLGVFERFENPSTKVNPNCPPGYRQCPSGDCVLSTDKHGGCPEKADDAY